MSLYVAIILSLVMILGLLTLRLRVWRKPKYKTFHDVPFSKLTRMSAKELEEIHRNIDPVAQRKRHMEMLELADKLDKEADTFYHPLIEGEVDTSHAVEIDFIDASPLRQTHVDEYFYLLNFQFNCLSNFALKRFPSYADVSKGLVTTDWKDSKRKNTLSERLIVAINQYNNKSQKTKLKFENLIAAKCTIQYDITVYLTFWGRDMETGECDVYEAALAQHFGETVLGLLRHYSTEKVLAILSLRGVEEDLATLRKFYADLPRRKGIRLKSEKKKVDVKQVQIQANGAVTGLTT